MRAPRDDDDYVLGNPCEPVDVAAGDTSLDLVTCSIGQLSDDEITAMSRDDLVDLLSLSNREPPFPKFSGQDVPDLAVLQAVVKDERDRCRSEMTQS